MKGRIKIKYLENGACTPRYIRYKKGMEPIRNLTSMLLFRVSLMAKTDETIMPSTQNKDQVSDLIISLLPHQLFTEPVKNKNKDDPNIEAVLWFI